ncbi:MAG: GFA family protein [Propionivibrio sp.]
MSDARFPLLGQCRCGQVQLRITAPPLLTAACHCTGCQRMSGSAFSLTAMVPAEAFEITAGEPVIGGLHGAEVRHFHCPHCMSWMFTRPADPAFPFVNVRPTMLEDCSWYSPFIETYTGEKLPWASTPAVHSFEKFPAMDAFESLAKAYAEQGEASTQAKRGKR